MISYNGVCLLKEWVSLFSWFMGNESGRGANKSCEPRNGSQAIFCFAVCFIPHEPRKKDTHSLYLQCFHKRPFLKFAKKSYKFKFALVMDTYNHIWCKSLCMWLAQLAGTTCRLCSSGIEPKIFHMVQWRRYYTIVNIRYCSLIEGEVNSSKPYFQFSV